MSGGEILLIILFVLIFFGADKMPEMARTLGKSMREFKKAADDIKAEITSETAGLRSDLEDIRSDLNKNVSEVRQEVDGIKTEIQQHSSEIEHELNNTIQNKDISYEVYDELKEEHTAPENAKKDQAVKEEKKDENPDIGAYI